ncbi:IS3 family transposase [Streptomyces sp. WZ-12]|uniref:IS3 family transposase n=1 Tax=Streptomyces sp. WZ-12 TaxID=3030210 RepID=UPI0023816383|nr:IS3 family transposase [Streptomyces sp. WZ-12]
MAPRKYSPEFREEAVRIALSSSKTVTEVGRELEMNPETLRGWVKKHQKRNELPADAGLPVSERARLKELERRNHELEMENAFLTKSRSVLREGSPVASKYEFIDEMRLDTAEYVYSVEFMCSRLGVCRSGYYEWRDRPESATAKRREELKMLIKKAFEESDSTYGYRRVHAQLARWGRAVGPELVRRLMREMGLEPCQPRPNRFGLTQATASLVPDLVGRDFTADTPGEKLVGDITYIPTTEGWLYLATIIDCCSKEVIGYAMDDHYRTPLIVRAIRNAARNRKLTKGAIFHSDRSHPRLTCALFWNRDEFAQLLDTWPEMADHYGDEHHQHIHHVQQTLQRLSNEGATHLGIAHGTMSDFESFTQGENLPPPRRPRPRHPLAPTPQHPLLVRLGTQVQEVLRQPRPHLNPCKDPLSTLAPDPLMPAIACESRRWLRPSSPPGCSAVSRRRLLLTG